MRFPILFTASATGMRKGAIQPFRAGTWIGNTSATQAGPGRHRLRGEPPDRAEGPLGAQKLPPLVASHGIFSHRLCIAEVTVALGQQEDVFVRGDGTPV